MILSVWFVVILTEAVDRQTKERREEQEVMVDIVLGMKRGSAVAVWFL